MICIITLGIELLITFLISAIANTDLTNAEAIVFIIIFGFSYFLMLFSSKKAKEYRIILLVGFVLRVALLLWDIYGKSIYGLPGSGVDTENFYNNAIRYAQGSVYWKNNAVVFFGILIKLFGKTRILIQFLLMLFSVATAHLVLGTLREIGISIASTKKGLWFLVLLPNYAILSALFLRESIITFLVALSLYVFIKWWYGKSEVLFWISILCTLLATVFHSGMIGVAAGYICIRVLYNHKSQTLKITVTSVLVIVICIFLFAFLYKNYGTLLFKKMHNIDELADISSGSGRGNSSYAAIAGNSSTVLNFIIYTPIRILLFLFTPLIFQIRGISDVIAMVFSAFFYLWTWIRILRCNRFPDKNKRLVVALAFVALVTAFIFGWGGTNIGTNIRHRDKIIPIYIILLAITFDNSLLKRERFRPIQ